VPRRVSARAIAVLVTILLAAVATVVVVTWRAMAPGEGDPPPIPEIRSVAELGQLTQHPRVNGRDNGQSTGYGDRSIWVFGDTVVREPWGFISSTGAATTDLRAADGITITSTDVFGTKGPVPTNMLPYTAAERAFTRKHAKESGCTPATDKNCGAQIGLWPGAIVADPERHRVLVFYAKLCRGGPEGSRCSGTLGHGLGTGIAALDMRTQRVTRLTAAGGSALPSVEGSDPTLFFPYETAYTAAAVLSDGMLYVYGDCDSRCHLARVPIGEVADRSSWTFYSGRDASGAARWTPRYADAATNLSAGSAGNSVIWVPALNAWLNVYLPSLSNELTAQVGRSPAGPWSRAFPVSGTDNAGVGTNYAGFAHPEYAEDDGRVQYFSYYQAATYQQRLLRVVFDD